MLVCDAENDLFFKGQPQQLFDHLTSPRTLMTFTEKEREGAHCDVGAAAWPTPACSTGSTKHWATGLNALPSFRRWFVRGDTRATASSRPVTPTFEAD